MPRSYQSPPRVLIIFNTVSLYGMERGVIETFRLLCPEVESRFLISFTVKRLNLPVLTEIERNKLDHSFFSDQQSWPRVQRPKSPIELIKILYALLIGNLDVLREARKTDFLYVCGIQYFYFALFASLLYKLKRKRIVFHFHDLVAYKSRGLAIAAIFVTDFVHNAEVSRDLVAAHNPSILKRHNVIIPYPTGTRPSECDKSELTAAFDGQRNIVFVGQVSRHKGVDLLLDAFNGLSHSCPNTTLHVVGGCDDPALKSQLDLQLANNCRIKYWGYRNDVFSLLERADVYVHPSPPSRFKESFGRGVVEAMSVGVPVVCFQSGALQEIVVHERTGLVCEEESVACLAASLRRLLTDQDFKERCAKQAMERYHSNYHDALVKSLWLALLVS